MNSVEVCLSPVLYPSGIDKTGWVTVVVDVLRATSSFCAALDAGAAGIITVPDLDSLKDLGKNGCITAAEREGEKVGFADFGNSPVQFSKSDLQGKTLAYSTTNGTRAAQLAINAGPVITACLLNLDKAVRFLLSTKKNVVILCSGWKDSVSLEDTVCAGAIVAKLMSSGVYTMSGDASGIARLLWQSAENDIAAFCSVGEHYTRLKNLGLDEDLEYCFRVNATETVPVWNGKMFVKQTTGVETS